MKSQAVAQAMDYSKSLASPAVSVEQSQGSLDDPTPGRQLEAFRPV